MFNNKIVLDNRLANIPILFSFFLFSDFHVCGHQNSDSEESSTSVDEETNDEDGEWVTREEADHARAMAAAQVEDAARIADLQQQLLTRQQHVEDTIGELSCKLIDTAKELDNNREVVNKLVALLVLVFILMVCRLLVGFF